jgi:23S rRNA (adenine2503-C2)-methyltransferase
VNPVTSFTADEFAAELAPHGFERWRARQILQWVYRRRAETFEVMTDLTVEQRAVLAHHFAFSTTRIAQRHVAPDGTTKLLLRLEDNNLIETVLIPDGDRKTVCVSTQVGCPIKCVF